MGARLQDAIGPYPSQHNGFSWTDNGFACRLAKVVVLMQGKNMLAIVEDVDKCVGSNVQVIRDFGSIPLLNEVAQNSSISSSSSCGCPDNTHKEFQKIKSTSP